MLTVEATSVRKLSTAEMIVMTVSAMAAGSRDAAGAAAAAAAGPVGLALVGGGVIGVKFDAAAEEPA
jgi:hypothetical protein